MFDDQPIGSAPPGGQTGGQPPANLPMGDPEDIFSASDAAPPSDNSPSDNEPAEPVAPSPPEPVVTAVPAPASPNSALGAGVLTPKVSPAVRPAFQPPPPLPAKAPGVSPRSAVPEGPVPMPETIGGYAVKRPSFLKELVIAIVVIAGLILLVGAAWTVYRRLRPAPVSPSPAPTVSETAAPTESPPAETPAATTPETRGTDEKILFGDTIDSDTDNLSDEEEERSGTNPQNWDTDGDTLSDGDEVLIWHTSPTNPDTDNDGYADGVEVKNGFNPNGPGKIFGAASTTKP